MIIIGETILEKGKYYISVEAHGSRVDNIYDSEVFKIIEVKDVEGVALSRENKNAFREDAFIEVL